MDDRMIILPRPIRPAEPKPATVKDGNRPSGASFDRVLQEELRGGELKFSRHAVERMETRGIQFSSGEMERLQEAVTRAGAKGARDSLVLLDQRALVVSVKNKTVVTVVDREGMQGNVFTNIDSAVIA